MTMILVVNGESRELPRDSTVTDLLTLLELAKRPVAVEVNRELVPRARHAQHRLCHGDQVELVTLVGGG